MRFAFAGIDFLGEVFQVLIDRGWQPVKLFTRPCDHVHDFNDVTVSRARRLRLPIQMSRIRPLDLANLKAMRCDVLVVAGYPWLVRDWEEHLPYAINFHPSPLPTGRGPYPLFQALLEGRSTWGMTAHALAPTFDTGPIVAQELFALSPEETHDSLLAKCQMAGKRLAAVLASDLQELWARAQPQGDGSYWPRITERERTLNWSSPVAEILRTVRAFGSIEAIARVADKRIFVWQASGWTEQHSHQPGSVVHRHRRHLVVAARDGFVQITGWSSIPAENSRETGR